MGNQLRLRWSSLALVIGMHFGALSWIGGQWEDYRAHAASSASTRPVTVRILAAASPLHASGKSVQLADTDFLGMVSKDTPNASQGATEIVQAPVDFSHFAPTLYYASEELDKSPSPVGPVLIPFPEEVLDQGKVEGVFLLYIGPTGKVERIETLQSTSFPALDHTAKEAFMQTAMHPGIKNSTAVGARMKVVVEFEAR